MDSTTIKCPFCPSNLLIEQEDHNSFIVICKNYPCDKFFLENPKSGATPEEAIDKLKQFLVELSLGGELWESKIKNGLVED